MNQQVVRPLEQLNITESIDTTELHRHNDQKYVKAKPLYELSREELTDTDAFKVAKLLEEPVMQEIPGEVYIEEYDINTGKMVKKHVVPAIDLRDRVDPEEIRNGLNHPAVVNNLNAIYMSLFREHVQSGLSKAGFIKDVSKLLDLRDDPNKVIMGTLEEHSTYFQTETAILERTITDPNKQQNEKTEASSKIEKYRAQSNWITLLTGLINTYKNAFLYSQDRPESPNPRKDTIAYVRPSENDNSLLCFTPYGLVEITSEGFSSEELLDLTKLLPVSTIFPFSKSAQEAGNPNTITLKDIDIYVSEDDPDAQAKTEIRARLVTKIQNVSLVYRMGYSETLNMGNLTTDELSKRLSEASNTPWPKVEQKVEVEPQTKQDTTGTDILGELLK